MFLKWGSNMTLDGYQFVVIGAGPAGLYLAQSLAPKGKVLVIEAGNTDDVTSAGDDYYGIVATGRNYPSIGTRLSSFGGTSNHWGGHSHPMSKEVFRNRLGIPGWPISFEEYALYLDGAARFLNLSPFGDGQETTGLESGIFANYQDLVVSRFQYSSPIVRLGDSAYVEAFGARSDIDVLTDVRLMEINLSPDEPRVQSIELLHRPSKQTAAVSVRRLFVCAGGIENARILLWSGRKYPTGNPLLGGPNRLTGTNFTEKPYFSPVELFLDSRADLSDASARDDDQTDLCWELSEEFRTRHELPRFGVFPGSGREVASDDRDLARVTPFYAGQSSSYTRLDPAFQFEQTPHDASFVSLSEQLDTDGIALPAVHWQIAASDFAAYRRATLMFCGVLNQKGFAKARLKPEFRTADWSAIDPGLCYHHIGTTRMGDSNLDGVVDRNCRVFGLDNLFVAGCSVFPSCDFVNPTLNLVAMTGRLADHIVGTMRTVLRFGLGSPDNAALSAGWSDLEPTGVWSDGRTARLDLVQIGARGLLLSGTAFYETRGVLSINGAEVFRGELKEAIGRRIGFAPADSVVMEFEILDPSSPKERGESQDSRLLGIFLSGLELT